MTYLEELQSELKTFKEIYLTRFSNKQIKELAEIIISWYEEAIKREEKLNDFKRRCLGGGPADQGSVIKYP